MGFFGALGVLLVFVGAFLLLAWQSSRRRLGQMSAVPVAPIADVVGALAAMLPERPYQQPDPFLTRPVAVEGTISCDSPLTSELGNVPCVFYKITVKRRYRRRSQVVERRSHGVPFWVEDATGRILVDPTGATVDGLRVVDEFEPASGHVVMLGSTPLHLSTGTNYGQERGVRYRETVVPLDRPVYVLGEASNGPNGPVIRKPADGQLLLSLKSGKELAEATDAASCLYMLLGFGALALGAILLALEFLV